MGHLFTPFPILLASMATDFYSSLLDVLALNRLHSFHPQWLKAQLERRNQAFNAREPATAPVHDGSDGVGPEIGGDGLDAGILGDLVAGVDDGDTEAPFPSSESTQAERPGSTSFLPGLASLVARSATETAVAAGASPMATLALGSRVIVNGNRDDTHDNRDGNRGNDATYAGAWAVISFLIKAFSLSGALSLLAVVHLD